jgi:hypothetical protein
MVAEVVITLLLIVSNGPLNQFYAPAADVALFVCEFGAHVGAHEFFGELFAGNARTQNENINIVVLDALVGGVSVRAHAGADAADFVGGDAGADAAAADEYAAFGAAVEDGLADGFREVGVVGGVFVVGADVEDFVAE